MQWLIPAGLPPSLHAPKRRPGPGGTNCTNGKIPLRRPGVSEAEGLPGRKLERRGW